MPFKKFLRMNRMVIKLTHIPVLFTIFVYERLLLSHLAYGPTDLVEQRGRKGATDPVPAFSIRGPIDLFSPRLREPSVTTFHKDRALEEVFRRPYRDSSIQTPSQRPTVRRKSSNVVSDWMRTMENDDERQPPQEDTRSVLDRLETRRSTRPYLRRTKTAGQTKRRHPLASARAVMSDPDESTIAFAQPIAEENEDIEMGMEDVPQQTDADGDDEDDRTSYAQITPGASAGLNKEVKRPGTGYESSDEEFFRTPMTVLPRNQARTPARNTSRKSSIVKSTGLSLIHI